MDQKFLAIVIVNFEDLAYKVLSRGQTIDSELYIQFIEDAVANFLIHNLFVARSISSENMILMHDNARPHESHRTKEYLEDKNVCLQSQAPYSPNIKLRTCGVKCR